MANISQVEIFTAERLRRASLEEIAAVLNSCYEVILDLEARAERELAINGLLLGQLHKIITARKQ